MTQFTDVDGLSREELCDRIYALESALAPFAVLADEVDDLGHSDNSTCLHRLAARDLRTARDTMRNAR